MPLRPFRQKVYEKFIREDLHRFINLVGIDSWGLTCALSIGEYVKKIVEGDA